MHNNSEKRITPQQAQQILKEGKLEVTIKEAEEILDFVYILAEAALAIYVFPEGKPDPSPSKSKNKKKR